MSQLSEADRFLIEQVRKGDAEGWSQLVDRYQGRLVSFARQRVGRAGDAEDLVQDTFIGFLKGLPRFREEASVETYLFTILRRKIIDHVRGKHLHACLLQDVAGTSDDEQRGEAIDRIAGDDLTASRYARRDEHADHQRQALAIALNEVVDNHKQSLNFEVLKIIELLFYAQVRNKHIADVVGVTEQRVALIKHRSVKQLQERAMEIMQENEWEVRPLRDGNDSTQDSLITEVWEAQRPSCPKRSTLGGFTLDTLEPDWHAYVDYHVNKLGCRFCQANLDDLKEQTEAAEQQRFRQRVMDSTAGFLSRA
jgi:RNA polymerase sigma factor (sigma-70 family)